MLRTICLFSALASVALITTGCTSTSRALGLEKSAPNEFNILTKAPLVVPPEYNLAILTMQTQVMAKLR